VDSRKRLTQIGRLEKRTSNCGAEYCIDRAVMAGVSPDEHRAAVNIRSLRCFIETRSSRCRGSIESGHAPITLRCRFLTRCGSGNGLPGYGQEGQT